jgi:hypothetical protein
MSITKCDFTQEQRCTGFGGVGLIGEALKIEDRVKVCMTFK